MTHTYRLRRREKTFGPGRCIPLDRNAKARIMVYARAWTAKHRQDRQHKGPITRAFMEVLEALLWGFHNSRDGRCMPSYESIAAKAECAPSTVAEALKVLEFAGILTWQNRITRIREQCRDLFGNDGWRWRVIRISNAYQFNDPLCRAVQGVSSKSENQSGTLNQELSSSLSAPLPDPDSPLERALSHLGTRIKESSALEGSGSPIRAT